MLKKIVVAACAAVLLASVPALAGVIGKPAPEIKLMQMDGKEFNLAAFKDKKPVVIAVFQSACGSCVADLQFLSKIAPANAHAEFVAINVDMTAGEGEWNQRMTKYFSDKKINMPVAADPKFTVGRPFDVGATPTTVLIGKDGKIVDVITGFQPGQSEAEVEKKIQALK